MADIELVIKISEEDYNNIAPFLNGKPIKGGFNLFKALEIIKNGTPLNEVLDEIRAEIKLISPKTYPFLNSTDNYVKEDDVLQIIDKYRKEQEWTSKTKH